MVVGATDSLQYLRTSEIVISPAVWLSPERAMAPHSSTLAWKIPWMEEPGSLQSMGSLRVGHDWATSLSRIREGHGNLLQYSCLENSMDREPWWATVHVVARVGHSWATNSFTFISSTRECFHLNCSLHFPNPWVFYAPPSSFIFQLFISLCHNCQYINVVAFLH